MKRHAITNSERNVVKRKMCAAIMQYFHDIYANKVSLYSQLVAEVEPRVSCYLSSKIYAKKRSINGGVALHPRCKEYWQTKKYSQPRVNGKYTPVDIQSEWYSQDVRQKLSILQQPFEQLDEDVESDLFM
jgi:hypothetical protein